jgi:hypothetical protein
MSAIEAEGSAEAHVRILALAFVRRASPSRVREAESARRTLFSLLDHWCGGTEDHWNKQASGNSDTSYSVSAFGRG